MEIKKLSVLLTFVLLCGCNINNSSNVNSSTRNSSFISSNSIVQSSNFSESYINSSSSSFSSNNSSVVLSPNSSSVENSFSEKEESQYDENEITYIDLNNMIITNNNNGVKIDNKNINITKAGVYKISGNLENGSIVINAYKEEKINLILDSVNITSNINSPLYCLSADKLVIELFGTNILEDASNYVYVDETNQEPNACLFSKDDLTIKGTGKLIINGNFNNGIGTKDDLKIKNGTIEVNAKNNGLKGNDSIQISGGNIKVNSTEGDGLKSDNEEDTTKGYIDISGGELNIESKYDGFQASNYINVTGGNITIKTSNGSSGSLSSSDTNSYKGVKASNDINISNGIINVNSLDDCIHSNKNVNISGGTMILSSADDGVHADEILHITKGDITITKSYEGLEAMQITIDGGNINIKSSDDGINVAGGDGSNNDWIPGGGGGRPGWWANRTTNLVETTLDYVLTINDGYIYVDASGDGLDSNGDIYINGGLIIVNGPTQSMNGALDYGDGGAKLEITNGTLIAVGSNGMAVGPTNGSSQCSAKITLSSISSFIAIVDSNGNEVIVFKPSKTIQSMVISSPSFVKGEKYTLYINGSYDGGTNHGGLYSGGSYVKGTQKTSFTFSNTNINVTAR